MIDIIISLVSYGITAIFGIALSAVFSSADKQKNAIPKIASFCLLTMLLQALVYFPLGFDATQRLYPLIVHLPLVLFLVKCFKISWVTSVVSVLTAYQCCQILRWAADLAYLFTDNGLWRNLLYVLFAPLVYWLLCRFAAPPMQNLMCRSRRTTLMLGGMPLLYYIFDYTSTIYTDLLYSGHPFAVQFMPSAMCLCYFPFLLTYQAVLEKQEKAQQERELLALQLRRAEAEFSSIRQMQEQAHQYRHDLRHHFALLMGFAEEGDLAKLKEYLLHNSENLDRFTPKAYCGNTVVNLLLSHFEEQATAHAVTLKVSAVLPEDIPFSDTELCGLLSNGLENAIHAAAFVQGRERVVLVSLQVRQQNLLLSIQNPYEGEIIFENGIPVSSTKGHGFGSRSIVSIVNEHSGQVSFSAHQGTFLLRVMLPIA